MERPEKSDTANNRESQSGHKLDNGINVHLFHLLPQAPYKNRWSEKSRAALTRGRPSGAVHVLSTDHLSRTLYTVDGHLSTP